MTKSYADMFLGLYDAVFRDVQSAFPCLRVDCERDLARLRAFVQRRGWEALVRDLPQAGKHFDKCLDAGQYAFVGLPLTSAVNKRIRVPEFLRGLMLLIFDERGHLREEVDFVAISFVRQLYRLVSKVKLQCPQDAIDNEVASFLEVDSQLPEPSGFWEDYPKRSQECLRTVSFQTILEGSEEGRRLIREDTSLCLRLDRVFSEIASALGQYRPSEWRFRHGPGATSAGTRHSNKYHWVSWNERLEEIFPIADYGYYSYSSWVRSIGEKSPLLEVDEPSRLIAVHKTLDKPRLIAAEPASNQWCQQNMRHFFSQRCSHSWLSTFVDFRDQTRNQELCLAGSRLGHLATLDLSEASDRVTCNVVQAAFRHNVGVLNALYACRTRFVRVELGETVFTHRLNKFSTMGSAVTFPVESLLFLGIALAACGARDLRTIEALSGTVSVYGDDIIVPATARNLVQTLLEALSFKVNTAKSFSEGNFRESCGVDAFRGVNVTPTYLRRAEVRGVESMVGLTETANHFYKKWQLNASEYLRRTVEQRLQLPSVHADSTVIGFASRVPPTGAPKFRWNKHLQRVECQVNSLQTESTEHKSNDDTLLLQFFTEDPSPYESWSAGQKGVPKSKTRLRWVDCVPLYKSWLSRGG